MIEHEPLLKVDYDSDAVGSVKIPAEEKLAIPSNPFLTKASSSINFWESLPLDELAIVQNVQPMRDIRMLFGTWPGEENDGFEEDIDELRHQGSTAENILP